MRECCDDSIVQLEQVRGSLGENAEVITALSRKFPLGGPVGLDTHHSIIT
jgi:hypothetical protein